MDHLQWQYNVYYPHTPIGMLGIYQLLFVCFPVHLFVCPQDIR